LPTQLIPYALLYGIEVVLTLEIQIPLLSIAIREVASKDENYKLRLAHLDALMKEELKPSKN